MGLVDGLRDDEARQRLQVAKRPALLASHQPRVVQHVLLVHVEEALLALLRVRLGVEGHVALVELLDKPLRVLQDARALLVKVALGERLVEVDVGSLDGVLVVGIHFITNRLCALPPLEETQPVNERPSGS